MAEKTAAADFLLFIANLPDIFEGITPLLGYGESPHRALSGIRVKGVVN
jgi:uncharacterized membrane protein